ncbi:putative zinc ribbon protein [Anaerobacterium chartisolvens]|uniref:Putative zinc ribbon protein n=1 Tax=Anaerobacterium chartisolvens TaxID=1297424 RepID=A0A369B5J1_9FIRM|nr:zinc-ribbon domain-containing protein [Anaerobacterium chartisolvens]RCX16585.1 putative zinc ribbon protein [Anaerobacterium chartisolvens]
MADKTLVCKDCGAEFIFTEGEQAFYQEKGFENEPQRCRDCRKAKKQQRRSNSSGFGVGRNSGGRNYSANTGW